MNRFAFTLLYIFLITSLYAQEKADPWLQDLLRYEGGWAMTRATLRSV